MAGNLTDYAENLLLDTILSGAKVALYTASPGEGGGGTEVTGGAYARQTLGAAAASGGATANAADVVFPQATADWGTIVAAAIWDAAGTHMTWYANLNASKIVQTGDQVVIPASFFGFSMD